MRTLARGMAAAVLLQCACDCAPAADWPEWRGSGRGGVWEEDGILRAFPPQGLDFRWRVPIGAGFSGPAVAGGRVFVTDFVAGAPNRGTERVLCFDEQTGKLLWKQEWEENYTGLSLTYATGPRATPTVDGDRVYALGAMGVLVCLNVKDGAVRWRRHYAKDFGTSAPVWGIAGAPLVDGDRLICLAGGAPDAKVVALDKKTGREMWRALSGESEPGYSQPILAAAGKRRQVIVWHPEAVSALDPETGRTLWEQPFRIHLNLPVATPVLSGSRLLVSSFFNGSMLLDLDPAKPAARLLWKGASDSEIRSDGLHSLVSTPVIDGDYIYGVCSYGEFRCLRLSDGKRVWQTQQPVGEKARWATAFIVRQGSRYFINNDRGELIIARLSPDGYEEVSRTQLIKPTSQAGNRREKGAVNWTHPAYANGHVFTRNDEELVRASLQQ
ncbi:MAG: PQQ-binding-like beta-propeller repeat protein [Bryobacteraceae bacterium]|nr:PQQ-binding-like beta-propeller repeat protein [Bryobacteraceae bacterium]